MDEIDWYLGFIFGGEMIGFKDGSNIVRYVLYLDQSG